MFGPMTRWDPQEAVSRYERNTKETKPKRSCEIFQRKPRKILELAARSEVLQNWDHQYESKCLKFHSHTRSPLIPQTIAITSSSCFLELKLPRLVHLVIVNQIFSNPPNYILSRAVLRRERMSWIKASAFCWQHPMLSREMAEVDLERHQ